MRPRPFQASNVRQKRPVGQGWKLFDKHRQMRTVLMQHRRAWRMLTAEQCRQRAGQRDDREDEERGRTAEGGPDQPGAGQQEEQGDRDQAAAPG